MNAPTSGVDKHFVLMTQVYYGEQYQYYGLMKHNAVNLGTPTFRNEFLPPLFKAGKGISDV
jgi:hypothetical protein